MKKIIIIGPECTGKSTLTKGLSKYFKSPYIEEYARKYIGDLGRSYTKEDILEIAKKQVSLEDEFIPKSDYLFCDTDLIVCKVWSEFKYGDCPPWILNQIAQRYYDYYLLCDIDLPWQKDKQREHPNKRQELFKIYQNELINLNKSFSVISGQNRLKSAIKILDSLSL